jgi:hypothetical protein
MVSERHYKRLEEMYAASPSASGEGAASVSYGRAELQGQIGDDRSGDVFSRTPHHALLNDAASLAAGSLEKERQVTAEQFQADVVDSTYSGPVSASARVVVAQPPRYVVESVLRAPDGTVVAAAMGVFHPTGASLPDTEVSLDDARERRTPPPASFIPLFDTPFGPVCLN